MGIFKRNVHEQRSLMLNQLSASFFFSFSFYKKPLIDGGTGAGEGEKGRAYSFFSRGAWLKHFSQKIRNYREKNP